MLTSKRQRIQNLMILVLILSIATLLVSVAWDFLSPVFDIWFYEVR